MRTSVLAVLTALVALSGCGAAAEQTSGSGGDPAPSALGTPSSSTPSASSTSPASSSPAPAPSPATSPEAGRRLEPAGPATSDGTPRTATLSIPQIGLQGFAVRPYRGTTDDAPGTDIQNAGDLASPFGPDGGVGPGGVGNYLVTGHRLSSTQPFLDLPVLERGDRFTVTTAQRAFVYEVRSTRITSFRSAASLAAQRAAVPGRPGVAPTRAMVTLSTCRTPEDRAEGNYFSDEFGNPENRVDKIGVLVESRPV